MTTYKNIIRAADIEALHANWTEQLPRKGTGREFDYRPLVKLFTPWAGATWLLTELDPESSLAFGLCDLGLGCAELGYLCLDEIAELQGPGGIGVEQDLHFKADRTLAEYAADARSNGGSLRS